MDRNENVNVDGDGDEDSRLSELTLIDAMYPNQLECDDQEIGMRIKNQSVYNSAGGSNIALAGQSISGVFTIESDLAALYYILPPEYPSTASAQVYFRVLDGSFKRSLQIDLNKSIREMLDNDQCANLMMLIPEVIQLWQNTDKTCYKNINNAIQVEVKDNSAEDNVPTRYWIYSHHIRSKTKRKMIIELSAQLNLTGLMLIGKPGFICIEGKRVDCEEWWSKIRALPWYRINLIDTETLASADKQAFTNFTERIDRSAVFRMIQSKQCDAVLNQFLGFSSNNSNLDNKN